MSRTHRPLPRRGRHRALVVTAATTLSGVLALAIVVELGRHPPARLAIETGVLLSLFVALYVVLLVHPEQSRDGRSLLAFGVLVGSVVEIVHLTHDDVWIMLFVGAAVLAGARLRGVATGVALLALGGLTVWFVASPIDDFAVIVAEVALAVLAGTLTLLDGLLDVLAETRTRLQPVTSASVQRPVGAPLEEILGHALALIGVKLEVVRRELASNPAAAGRELKEVDALVRRSLAAVRGQEAPGLLPSLDQELKRARQVLSDAGVVVDIDIETDAPLPRAADELFCLALEVGVTDILHDPSAERASVRLERWRDGLALRIRDDRVDASAPAGEAAFSSSGAWPPVRATPRRRPENDPGPGGPTSGGGVDRLTVDRLTDDVGLREGGWPPVPRRLTRLAEQASRRGGRVHVGRGPDGGHELVAWVECPRPASRPAGRSTVGKRADRRTMQEEVGPVGLGRATNF